MSSVPVEIRLSQRAPQSCRRCSNRKIRCSKTVPCEACTNLGLAHQCEREVVIITRQERRTVQTPRRRGRPPGSLNKRTTQSSEDARDRRSQNTRSRTPTAIRSPQVSRQSFVPSTITFPLSTGSPFTSGAMPIFQGEHALIGSHVHKNQHIPSPDSISAESGNIQSQSPSEAIADLSSSTVPNGWRNDEALAENAAMTLEFLAWGRQRDTGVSPESVMSIQPSDTMTSVLNVQQAKGVIDFHRGSLTWMHNVIHWPSFYDECDNFWQHGVVEEKTWMALYYAVLALGVHHMNAEQHISLGIYNGVTTSRDNISNVNLYSGDTTARRLYERAYEALKDADFMAVHSVNAVKVIILLSLMAHSFDGSNLISVLLSCAIRIAQTLNFHSMGPDPTEPLPVNKGIERELRKRIWTFLCIQDWFLIPFDNSYSISPQHCNTPMPSNNDDSSGLEPRDRFSDSTQMGYILIIFRVAEVYRNFYDKTSSLEQGGSEEGTLRQLYDHVLTSDTELKAVLKTAPEYLQKGISQSSGYPPYVFWQQRTFAISFAHKTLMIHQRFFLKSLRDKWYTYTRITCIQSARTILEEFYSSFKDESNDMWTILAHVVSASIILLLDHVLSEDNPSSNRHLVCDCLALLERSKKQSTLLRKGIRLIHLLLQYKAQGSPPDLAQIALRLKEDGNFGSGLPDGQVMMTGLGANESWNWDQFFNSIDMNFDGSFS